MASESDLIHRLAKFFRAGMATTWEACDWDGADIQDTAESLGLVVKAAYDPATHGDHGLDEGLEPGDEWFVIAPEVRALTDSSKETTHAG
jgi:hypothetical protein